MPSDLMNSLVLVVKLCCTVAPLVGLVVVSLHGAYMYFLCMIGFSIQFTSQQMSSSGAFLKNNFESVLYDFNSSYLFLWVLQFPPRLWKHDSFWSSSFATSRGSTVMDVTWFFSEIYFSRVGKIVHDLVSCGSRTEREPVQFLCCQNLPDYTGKNFWLVSTSHRFYPVSSH